MDGTLDKLPLSRAERHPEKAHRPDNPIRRKPDWIRVRAPNSPEYAETKRLMRQYGLATVCEEAACPNIGECWKQKHATFMIMGETCTRACAFCNVATGKPGALDPHEPANIAEAVGKLGLGHVVVTSVDRDDLADGGAGHFAAVITALHQQAPGTTIEVLTPDFMRKAGAIETVVAARPDVFNHNLETVPRLYPTIRPGARYFTSLQPAVAREGDRSRDVHQVRPHGRPGRDARGDPAGDGRSARRRRRFPDGRPVPAADAEACADRPLLDAGRVRRARHAGARQGLPDGRRPRRSRARAITRATISPG